MKLMEPNVVIQPVIIKNEKFTTNSPTTAEQEMDSVINFNDEYRIPIKRSVLYERCNFFTSMINFKETNAEEIDIHYDADFTVFQALVDYIHTGKIELSTSNLEAIIRAAIYFQLDDLLKCCCNVLKQNTDLQTVGHIYNLAKELALNQLRKDVVDFQVEYFHEIAKSEVFCEWLVDCMLELLSSDEVVVSHEEKILKFVFDWLNVDPNERGEHATDLFRKLRFSYLNDKNVKEIVEGNSNEKLGQILQQVASEFSNQITPPRIYHKGIYMSGITCPHDGDHFVRYCPDDGSIMNLKTPNVRKIVGDCVINNDDIYQGKFSFKSGTWSIHVEKYDAKKDTWTSRASTAIENVLFAYPKHTSVCQEKIFVFIKAGFMVEGTWEERNFCMMNCIKTNTWSRVSAFEGKEIVSSTTCGDCIYMVRDDSTNLLQYKPSTGELIDIPCQYNIKPRNHKAIAYKSNILFLAHGRMVGTTPAVLFNTDTKDFRLYDFTETFKTNDINRYNDNFFRFALFKDSIFFFTQNGKVFKLELSFIEEKKEPTLIPLPPIGIMYVRSIASIQ